MAQDSALCKHARGTHQRAVEATKKRNDYICLEVPSPNVSGVRHSCSRKHGNESLSLVCLLESSLGIVHRFPLRQFHVDRLINIPGCGVVFAKAVNGGQGRYKAGRPYRSHAPPGDIILDAVRARDE